MTQQNEDVQLTPPVNEKDHSQGAAAAPMTLVEYADYQCPYCKAAYTTVKELQQKLGNQLRFVFRNYPLVDSHPNAEHAAEAAEIAASQGKFWEMHQLLFEHQDELDDAHLVHYAEQVGVDRSKFIQAMTDSTYTQRVVEDADSGDQSDVEATPTFFINGQKYQGEADTQSLLQALQQAARH